MIRCLKHLEIDRARWDDCISRALNRRVYAYSWYLDIVSPGWEGLAEDDYSSVFPLTWGRKAYIPYLFQPFFAQQLGLFSTQKMDVSMQRRFIESIPGRFRYIDIRLNSGFFSESGEYNAERCINHELELGRPYDEISRAYSQNTRRNIRKAVEMGVGTGREIPATELTGLFKRTFGEREGKLKQVHYERIERLMRKCIETGNGKICAAYSQEGTLSAAVFFLTDKDRVYYLFAASDQVARENGAMFFLVDRFIGEHAGSSFILDFEGGNDPDLGRFYKSFGAGEVCYDHILINRLPFLTNWGFRLYKAARKMVK